MALNQIVKSYELRSLGGDKVVSELTRINNLFIEIRKNKVDLNALAKLATVEDPAKLAEINKQLADLKVQEKELQVELKKKQVLAKEAALAAALEAKDLQTLKVIEQELNIERKEAAKQRDKEKADAKAAKANNQALAGSYNDIAAKYKELLNISKNTTILGNAQQTEAAVQELRKLKLELDNFNRALSSDGTLIGEYSTGIVNAFKKLGLGDLIQKQTQQAKAALDQLDKEFLDLKKELREVQETGNGSLHALEQQLIENRNAAAGFSSQLTNIEEALRHTNEVGAGISKSIGDQFKQIKEDFVGFVVAYLGFQEAISKAKEAFQINIDFEKSVDQLQAITGVAGKGLETLKEKARENTAAAADETIKAYKTIVSQRQQLGDDPLGLEKVRANAQLLAQASEGELEPTVKDLLETMNQFNATADESTKIVDALAAGAKFGAAEVPDITAAIKEFGTQAKSMNVTITESVGLIELLAEKGITGAEAGTKLRNVLLALSATPALDKKALDELEKAGVDIKILSDTTLPLQIRLGELAKIMDNNTALVRVFGKENFNAAQILLQNNARFGELTQQISATGVAMQQAAIATDNVKTRLDRLGNAFKNFATSDTFNAFLSALVLLLTFLINNIPVIITLTGAWAVNLALQNAELVVLNVQLFAINARLLLYRTTLAAITIFQTAYNVVMASTTRLIGANTVATILLGNAMRLLPFGILLTIVGVVAGSFNALATSINSGNDALREKARLAKLDLDLNKEVNQSISSAVSRLQQYVNILYRTNIARETQVKIMDQLKRSSDGYLNTLTLENIRTAEGIKLINQYVATLRQKAEAQAASAQRDKALQEQLGVQEEAARAAKDPNFAKQKFRNLSEENAVGFSTPFLNSLYQAAKYGTFDSEQAFLKDYYKSKADEIQKTIDFYDKKVVAGIVKDAEKNTGPATGTVAARRKFLDDEIKNLKEDYENLALTDEAGRKKNIAQRKEYENELKDLNEKEAAAAGPQRVSAGERDRLNEADAARDELLANEKLRYLESKKQHQLTEDEEIAHLDKLQQINSAANKKKLALITGNNPAEKKARADLRLKEVEDVQATEDAKYKVRLDSLNSQREKLQQAAEQRLADTEADPQASDLQKAAAKANYLDSLVTLQQSYNQAANDLDKQYGVSSKKNEDERNAALLAARRTFNKQLNDVTQEGAATEIEDIRKRSNEALDKIYQEVYDKAAKIFNNRGLSRTARSEQVRALENEARRQAAEQQLQQYDQEIAENQRQLDQKLIDQQEYNKRAAALNKQRYDAQQQINNAEVEAERNKQRRIQDAINAGERIARMAVSAYIDGLNQKIQAKYDETRDYLSKEKEQRLAQATSEDERLAIEEEYDQKNKELQKKQNEEQKEIKRKQIILEFAVASARAIANGLEIGGPLGLANALVQEAIVAAEFAAQLAILDSTKYAQGGQLYGNRSALSRGGVFSGPSHAGGGIPLMLSSGAAEVEGGEGYVIKQAAMQSSQRMTATGTPAQLASAANAAAGGVNFAPGAAVRMFAYGGYLGANLQAPVYVPASPIAAVAGGDDPITAQIAQLYAIAQAQQGRIDNLRVTLVPQQVADVNKKRDKTVTLGTL